MKIKVSEATICQIDYLVAKCEGYTCQFDDEVSGPWLVPDEPYLFDEIPLSRYTPSTDPSQGYPIIERELNVLEKRDGYWYAWRAKRNDGSVTMTFATMLASREAWAYGPTPLIAAMRAYVISKLGDYAEIPEELK